jgi:hypothetical protein
MFELSFVGNILPVRTSIKIVWQLLQLQFLPSLLPTALQPKSGLGFLF